MKPVLTILFSLFLLGASAQSKEEVRVMAQARALNEAVFGKRDSAFLARVFATGLTYGHSGGKLESREQALDGIVHNKSKYTDVALGPTTVAIEGKTAVTRYLMTGNEHKADGTVVPLKLHIVLTWAKVKKDWKLLARQAVKMN